MTDQPNVLLISTDHWPAALLGAAGHATIETPTLDQLAANGVRFSNAYAECPVCIPARRTLMTGTPPRVHGDRVFLTDAPMPALPTLAQTFRNAGYQAYAVGKLHVYPQRDRIGFDDVILAEEGRPQLGAIDDYELWLGEEGLPGQSFAHGMSNNEYGWRPWHLDERHHVTNWATQQMARMIRRRDPTRPGFWFLSYCHPHPPLAPLQSYLERYRDVTPAAPVWGEWARERAALPYALQAIRDHHPGGGRAGDCPDSARILRPLHPHRPPAASGHRYAARGDDPRQYRSSASLPITATCWAITASGPSVFFMKILPTCPCC